MAKAHSYQQFALNGGVASEGENRKEQGPEKVRNHLLSEMMEVLRLLESNRNRTLYFTFFGAGAPVAHAAHDAFCFFTKFRRTGFGLDV